MEAVIAAVAEGQAGKMETAVSVTVLESALPVMEKDLLK